ncbi:MAG: hypothetical protein ABL952_13515, partial [Pyrinomonadaceae bacterium]
PKTPDKKSICQIVTIVAVTPRIKKSIPDICRILRPQLLHFCSLSVFRPWASPFVLASGVPLCLSLKKIAIFKSWNLCFGRTTGVAGWNNWEVDKFDLGLHDIQPFACSSF